MIESMKNAHEETIYRLMQSTLDMMGNTFEAMKDYCLENNLKWKDWEYIRFSATTDYPNCVYDK